MSISQAVETFETAQFDVDTDALAVFPQDAASNRVCLKHSVQASGGKVYVGASAALAAPSFGFELSFGIPFWFDMNAELFIDSDQPGQRVDAIFTQPNSSSPAPPSVQWAAQNFDGVNDRFDMGINYLPAIISSLGVLSLRFKRAGTGSIEIIAEGAGAPYGFYIMDTNKFRVLLKSVASGTTRLDMIADTTVEDTDWHHILCSWDLSGAPQKHHMYLDDVDVKSVTTESQGTINYNADRNKIGASGAVTPLFHYAGCMAQLWFYPTVYLDLSIEANRRLFVNADGSRVPLGINGQLPIGISPYWYFSTDNFMRNRGLLGNIIAQGVPTPCTDGPT